MQSLQTVAPAAGESPAHPLTIEQLAAASGLSVRNIRSHQARGLLPPPEVRGRVGYYGDEHLERLRAIQELQSEGLNLKAIAQLLGDTPGTAERLLRLKRTIASPLSAEEPELVGEPELLDRLGPNGRRLRDRLQRLGFVTPVGAGHYDLASPALIDVLREAERRGISAAHVVELLESLHSHSQAVARRLVKSFLDDVWKPFVEAGLPEDEWPELAASIERLLPLGVQALAAVFTQTMGREVDATLGDVTRRLPTRKP